MIYREKCTYDLKPPRQLFSPQQTRSAFVSPGPGTDKVICLTRSCTYKDISLTRSWYRKSYTSQLVLVQIKLYVSTGPVQIKLLVSPGPVQIKLLVSPGPVQIKLVVSPGPSTEKVICLTRS